LLLNASARARARHAEAAPGEGQTSHRSSVHPRSHLRGIALPSQHLVAYKALTSSTTTTAPPPTTTTAPLVTTTTEPPPPTTTTTDPPPPPPTTTTALPPPPPPPPTNSETGEATWYSGAAPGGCASPTLPFGIVLTVVNDATGASTTCTVDDREAAGYPRIVDLSPAGFAQIADPSQGVVEVTISW
jgi:rare lipoprotein A (peptidoglycan hydrolase)